MERLQETTPLYPPDYTIPGMRIQKNPPSSPWALVIRCARKQEDWVPLKSRKFFDHKLMDTTIKYQGKFYRIHELEETESGWVYRLAPWPRGEIMCRTVELDLEKMELARLEKEDVKRMERRVAISPYYELFLGFLPARLQDKLAETWYFSPEQASRKNALAEFLVFFSVLAVTVAVILGYGDPNAILRGCLYCLLAFEGLIRWAHVLGSNEPFGLILLEAADRLGVFLWRKIRYLLKAAPPE